jgi:hypothetical protein
VKLVQFDCFEELNLMFIVLIWMMQFYTSKVKD